jgi:hypothetical protein
MKCFFVVIFIILHVKLQYCYVLPPTPPPRLLVSLAGAGAAAGATFNYLPSRGRQTALRDFSKVNLRESEVKRLTIKIYSIVT